MKKQWKHISWNDECPMCGSGVEVLTDCTLENQACDGDEARCEDDTCGEKGWVSVYDENEARINWRYEDGK